MRCEIAPAVRNISVHRSLSRALRVIYCCAAARPRAAISASCQNRNVLLSDESSGFHWDLARFPHPILLCCGVQALPRRPCFPRKRWGGTCFSSCRLYSLINLEQTANEWYGAFSLSLELKCSIPSLFWPAVWQRVLATESEFATQCAKCYLHQGRKGTRSTKGGSFNLFSRLVILTYRQHRGAICFKKIFPCIFFLWCKRG